MKTVLVVRYLGGHPASEKPKKNVNLTFNDDGISAQYMLRSFLNFPWADVTDVTIEGPEEAQKRVTMTRLIGLGIFAFAAKKADKQCFITVTTPGGEAIFESDKLTVQDARAKLQPALRNRTT